MRLENKNTILIIEHYIEESVADVSERSILLLVIVHVARVSKKKKNTTEGT